MRKHLRVASALIVVAWAPSASPVTTQTVGPSKIAFSSTRDGNAEIYNMDLDGLNMETLTDHPAVDELGGWSPDGSRIVFASARAGGSQIYAIDADGPHPIRLTYTARSDGQRTWCPDGTSIALDSYRDGDWDISIIDADGWPGCIRLPDHGAGYG